MPIHPADLPTLYARYQPTFANIGAEVTHDDFVYLYNLVEEAVREKTPVEEIEMPPEIRPFIEALYRDLKKKFDAEPPPENKTLVPSEAQVTGLRAALALLSANAVEKLKALFKRNPGLESSLKEIGKNLQRAGVVLVANQPASGRVGELTPGVGQAAEVERGGQQGRG